MKTLLELRVSAQKLRPTLHIGKDGLRDEVIAELILQMKKARLVKIRVLNSYGGNRKEIAADIAKRTSSTVVDVRGSTIVLAKDRNGQI